jgi:hypothetical protein
MDEAHEKIEDLDLRLNLLGMKVEGIEMYIQFLMEKFLNTPEPYVVQYGPGSAQIRGQGEDTRPAEDCVD